ncbi:glycoside hydrolase family 18 protein [Lunatimonas salinarum]|uniref:glycoside hydrolase family 18 protein n=1 Tax=Lunatimonas salinarum TaxID=1774590 RepID=UPI001FD7845F|nr:glycoside hydrolase family 18 protein [Lunatimonas salinarum]
MNRILQIIGFAFAIPLVLSCGRPDGEVEVNSDSELMVMAYYYASWRNAEVDELPFDKLTHIIYSFTEVIGDEMKFKNDSSAIILQKLVEKRSSYPHLKVMIACGGWGGSGGFSEMANDPERRRRFVSSVVDFQREHKLDGVDIDWEYPGLPGIGNPHIPEDKENFTLLMADLRKALDELEQPQLLTFAAAGWERFFDHIELKEVMRHVDYMNLMTYDLSGGGDKFTMHHTNLGALSMRDLEGTPAGEHLKERGDPSRPYSAEKIIRYCMDRGIDPGQLVIGAAFYGKGWVGVPPANNGLFQGNRGPWPGRGSYAAIRETMEGKGGFERHWDEKALAPYLYHPRDSVFITYEDTVSIRLKTRYAVDEGLGGIMFWQLGSDAKEDGLLDAIYREKSKP